VVVAFSDATSDRALQIYAPKLVLTGHPRDHPIAEAAARPRPRSHASTRGKCLLNIRRLPRKGGNALESRCAAAGETMTIANNSENVLAGAQQTERFWAGRRKDRDPGSSR
jgi:hypothetical protein